MKNHTTTTAVGTALMTALAGALTSCSATPSTHGNTTASTSVSPSKDPSQHVTSLLEGRGDKHNHHDHYLGENQIRSPGSHQIVGYDNYTGYSTNDGRLVFGRPSPCTAA